MTTFFQLSVYALSKCVVDYFIARLENETHMPTHEAIIVNKDSPLHRVSLAVFATTIVHHTFLRNNSTEVEGSLYYQSYSK